MLSQTLGVGLEAATEQSEKQQSEMDALRVQLEELEDQYKEKILELQSERDLAAASLDLVEESFVQTIQQNEDMEKVIRNVRVEKQIKEDEIERLKEELRRVQEEQIVRLQEELQKITQARSTLQQSAQTSFLSSSRRDGSLPGNFSLADLQNTMDKSDKKPKAVAEIATSPIPPQVRRHP